MRYEGEKIETLSLMVEKARIKLNNRVCKYVEAQRELDRLEKALRAKKKRLEDKSNEKI